MKYDRHKSTNTVLFHLHEIPGTGKFMETARAEAGGDWGGGRRGGELLLNEYSVSVWGDEEKVLERSSGDRCTIL